VKGQIMSNDTHNLSKPFFQALDYKIKKLSQLVDQLDVVAYQTRNALNNLSKTYQDICEREKE